METTTSVIVGIVLVCCACIPAAVNAQFYQNQLGNIGYGGLGGFGQSAGYGYNNKYGVGGVGATGTNVYGAGILPIFPFFGGGFGFGGGIPPFIGGGGFPIGRSAPIPTGFANDTVNGTSNAADIAGRFDDTVVRQGAIPAQQQQQQQPQQQFNYNNRQQVQAVNPFARMLFPTQQNNAAVPPQYAVGGQQLPYYASPQQQQQIGGVSPAQIQQVRQEMLSNILNNQQQQQQPNIIGGLGQQQQNGAGLNGFGSGVLNGNSLNGLNQMAGQLPVGGFMNFNGNNGGIGAVGQQALAPQQLQLQQQLLQQQQQPMSFQ